MSSGDGGLQTEVRLKEPPEDGISAVKFQPNSCQHLLVSSWDGSVRLYDVNKNSLRSTYYHQQPVLDCDFSEAARSFSGGLDCVLLGYDWTAGKDIVVGYHDRPIRCVHFSADTNQLVTGSWDSSVKLWDTRAPAFSSMHQQPDKVYTLDTAGHHLVVGTAGRHVLGYVLSSIEGRVAVEFFDTNPEVQAKKYAFKCHRVKTQDAEEIHPVNAVAFHRQFNTFATGGSDCMVNIWDGFNRKRLMQLHKFPTSISALAFADDGSMLAVAASYMFEQGEESATGQQRVEDSVFIRYTSDQEVRPKHMPQQ
uniref:WD_REPEATS_REGION domain-containing protein n=1 Tax=Macrostomum lignano TaxID=282301 RepID=A0A1I8H9V1_9PLAT